MAAIKLVISVATYNEIYTELEKLGIKVDGTADITLVKGTQLSCPVDFRLTTIRRDVANIAAAVYNKHGKDEIKSFPEFVSDLFDFVLNGAIKNEKVTLNVIETKAKEGWK